MTTRFSQIAQDWALTDVEKQFLSNVIVQIRKSEAIGPGETGEITFEDAINAVRRAAYEAEVQYRRTHYRGNLRHKECLDRAHGMMNSIMIEWGRIKPILLGYAEKKKQGTLR